METTQTEGAQTEGFKPTSTTSFLNLLMRAVIGFKDSTFEEANSNWKHAANTWSGAIGFVATREEWYAKALWAVLLVPWALAWTIALVLLTIGAPFLAPASFIVVVGSVLIAVDQLTYPINSVDPVFENKENATLTVDEKGGLLFRASYHQLESELNSFLGWCPNDLPTWPGRWIDNRCNRQLGVWYASKRAVMVLSERITKFGSGADENKDTLNAHMHLGNFANQWGAMGFFQDATERHYGAAVRLLKKFEAGTKTSGSTQTKGELINVRADDFVFLMRMLVADGGILTEPYGRLELRNKDVKYSEIDDDVYYAQGAAIVARDIAVAMRWLYAEELSRGGLDNLDAAIDALNTAAKYNPFWISRGDSRMWWSHKWADDRTKMQNYFTIAFRRIEDLKESLKS